MEPGQGAEIGSSPAESSAGSNPSVGAECPNEVRAGAWVMQGKYGFTDIRVSGSNLMNGDADGAVRMDLDRAVSWSAMQTGKDNSGADCCPHAGRNNGCAEAGGRKPMEVPMD